MTNTQTITTRTKTNHYLKALVALAMMATLAAMLLAAAGPAHAASNTFTVNRIDDREDANPGDGICSISTSGTFCTLRAAIQEANATPDKDTINFGINAAGGVATIRPNSPLPPITESVLIDGYTQQGASENTKLVGNDASLKIELDGTNAPGASGLEILNSSNSVIRGLAINRFSRGIFVLGDGAGASTGNRIEGNFLGTDPTGTLDEGNSAIGVFVDGGSANFVGGGLPEDANLISGNDQGGVAIEGGSKNQVAHNLIGTDRSGTKGLQNLGDGVKIVSSDNSVRNNTIAFNGVDGVQIIDSANGFFEPSGNSVLSNSIFSNGLLGISFRGNVLDGQNPATPNDLGDADTGPNGLQNKPVVSSAKTVSGLTTVKGKLNSRPSETYKLQFFSNPSGTNQGKKLIGRKSVKTDGDGNASFTFEPNTKVAVGRTITLRPPGPPRTTPPSSPRRGRWPPPSGARRRSTGRGQKPRLPKRRERR